MKDVHISFETSTGTVEAVRGVNLSIDPGQSVAIVDLPEPDSPTIAPYILPAPLGELLEIYPDLEPRFVEEQTEHLLEKLRDGQLDLAIIA